MRESHVFVQQTVQHFFVVMSATLQKKKGGGVELPAACALAAQPTTSFAVAGAPQAVGEGFATGSCVVTPLAAPLKFAY